MQSGSVPNRIFPQAGHFLVVQADPVWEQLTVVGIVSSIRPHVHTHKSAIISFFFGFFEKISQKNQPKPPDEFHFTVDLLYQTRTQNAWPSLQFYA